MVLSWWSQDLVRRPNNQNGQIQKLIFDPYFPLSSPFEKFWSIVQCEKMKDLLLVKKFRQITYLVTSRYFHDFFAKIVNFRNVS